jgi:predicted SAM-dependent methyltransferase
VVHFAKRLLRRRLTHGVIEAIRSLQNELTLRKRHRSGVRKARQYAHAKSLQLHLGCGPNYKQGWVNVDLFDSSADVSLDLREPFPFADGSVARIYAEHTFEHFSYPEEVNRLLAESLRVLAGGGLFEVGVPDTERAIYDYYVNRDPEMLATARRLWHKDPWCDMPLHQLNYHFRQGTEHKYAWDFETLASVLRKAGFTDVERRDFDPSIDDEKRRGTLWIRARKGTD